MTAWRRSSTSIIAQKGNIDPDKTMELLKGWKNDDSPRGPIMIDPETRDIVQNEYLRRIEKVNGELANVEFETIADGEGPVEGDQPPKCRAIAFTECRAWMFADRKNVLNRQENGNVRATK